MPRMPRVLMPLAVWFLKQKPDYLKGGEGIDYIVPISYTTRQTGLVAATWRNLAYAVELARKYPGASMCFSSCEYVFPGAAKLEEGFKLELLKGRIPNECITRAGLMNNSIEEAQKIKEAILQKDGKLPSSILIVTGELHVSSVRLIWKRLFPGTHIWVVVGTPYECEVQDDHPVEDQRCIRRWCTANLARRTAVGMAALFPDWVLFNRLGRYQHKTA